MHNEAKTEGEKMTERHKQFIADIAYLLMATLTGYAVLALIWLAHHLLVVRYVFVAVETLGR